MECIQMYGVRLIDENDAISRMTAAFGTHLRKMSQCLVELYVCSIMSYQQLCKSALPSAAQPYLVYADSVRGTHSNDSAFTQREYSPKLYMPPTQKV